MTIDAHMPDATQTPDSTEGKGVSTASPSTQAERGSYVTAPGGDATKRRKVSHQMEAKNQFNSPIMRIQQVRENKKVRRNCLSTDHQLSRCPKPEANEWDNLLKKVRDGLDERRANMMDIDPVAQIPREIPKSSRKMDDVGIQRNREFAQQERDKSPLISFHHRTDSLTDALGKSELNGISVGGRYPIDLGFRVSRDMHKLIEKQMMDTNFIPPVGYQSQVDNTNSFKFDRWQESLKYGQIMAFPVTCEGFADPDYYNCGAKPNEFSDRNFDRNSMKDFTQKMAQGSST